MPDNDVLYEPLTLPCGAVLKNRIIKSAMSDSLGDGTGHPTPEQCRVYQRWAHGGLAAAIIGEVQGNSDFCEKPGNLVLNEKSDMDKFRNLSQKGSENGALIWMQLGHAGALAYAPTSKSPKGPSALHIDDLKCDELSIEEILQLPHEFARTAQLAKQAGFGGVQIHAAHGFLLSQFLSPLFNKRTDDYGGKDVNNRMRLLLAVIQAVRGAVGPSFPIALKLNSSDQLEGGLTEEESLEVLSKLDQSTIDLVDISGGTYFPGAKNASDATTSRGDPYFLHFAKRAKKVSKIPLMLTGGFKSQAQAIDSIKSGAVDVVGMARAFVLEPNLPKIWQSESNSLQPKFPRFAMPAPEGGITAFYTMRITHLGMDKEGTEIGDLHDALQEYDARDKERTDVWLKYFNGK